MQFKANLEAKPVPVVAMRPPTNQPSIAVGFVPESPLGPSVVALVSCALPGQPGLGFTAHLNPDEADELAGKLTLAAQEAREALQGREWPEAMDPEVLRATVEAFERRGPESEEPAIIGMARGADGSVHAAPVEEAGLMEGEAAGIECQIQHGSDKPCATEPGRFAFIANTAPQDGRPILMVIMQHPDGSQMGAYLEEGQIPMVDGLFHAALADIHAIRNGAPEGVKPS